MSETDAEKDKVAPLGVHALRVFSVGVGILVALLAAIAAMVGFYSLYAPSRQLTQPEIFPSPRVFERQGMERRELHAEQRRRLDRAAVPITQAMGLVVARGQSAYSPLIQPKEKPPTVAGGQKTPSVAALPARPRVERQRRQRHPTRGRGFR
jgi:hypothetical protein